MALRQTLDSRSFIDCASEVVQSFVQVYKYCRPCVDTYFEIHLAVLLFTLIVMLEPIQGLEDRLKGRRRFGERCHYGIADGFDYCSAVVLDGLN